MSLYRHNAVHFDDKDKFQESETIQIITGLDPGVTAANSFGGRTARSHGAHAQLQKSKHIATKTTEVEVGLKA